MSDIDEEIDSLSGEELSGEDTDSSESEAKPVIEEDDIDQIVEVPKDIKLNSNIVGLHCHPKKNLLAAGTIDGPVHLYSFSADEGNKKLTTYQHLKKHCRAVKFSESGEYLFAGSKDKIISVVDLETNSEYRRFSRTDGSPTYSLLPIDNYLLASGEDKGQVVIWDFRMSSPVACFEDCGEYISCLAVNKEKKTLFATCGDGFLVTYNIKARRLNVLSELYHSDFLSVDLLKNETKVVVGTGDGSLNIFNKDEYGAISDRFPGHPGSVDCMTVFSDDVVITGCEDGKIRAVQLFPSRFLGVLGHHAGFPIESISLSFDRSVVASASHDQAIKFWDLSNIENEKNEDVKNTKKKHQQVNKQVDNFYSDL